MTAASAAVQYCQSQSLPTELAVRIVPTRDTHLLGGPAVGLLSGAFVQGGDVLENFSAKAGLGPVARLGWHRAGYLQRSAFRGLERTL